MTFNNEHVTPSNATASRTAATLLKRYLDGNALTEEEVGQQLGLRDGAVIRQIVRGTMALPLHLLEPVAALLEMEKFDLLELVLDERQPMLLALFRELRLRTTLTDGELRLVQHLRALTAGRDCHPVVFEGGNVVAIIQA